MAIGALVVALAFGGPDELPVAQRRPPPAGGYSNAVGGLTPARGEPVTYERACAPLESVRVAGTEPQRQTLRAGLAALCNTSVSPDVSRRLRQFADQGGVVRFARFELTGVDSTAALAGTDAPTIYLNDRFSTASPLHVAPLIAHDVTFVERDPASAEAALEARRVEAAVCDALLEPDQYSRGCLDAIGLLELDDPLAALRDAGYR